MLLLLYIGVIIISYVVTFKNDFNPEHLEKAGPFIFVPAAILILLGLVGSILGRMS